MTTDGRTNVCVCVSHEIHILYVENPRPKDKSVIMAKRRWTISARMADDVGTKLRLGEVPPLNRVSAKVRGRRWLLSNREIWTVW